MNLGVMLSVKRWRRCCMWLMGKSQSHSRNVSLRYFYTGFILLHLQKKWKLHWGVSFSLTYTCLCMFGNKLTLLKLGKSSSFLVVILHVICIDVSGSLYKCRHSPCFCSYCASLKDTISQGSSCYQINLNINITSGILFIGVDKLLWLGKKSRVQIWEGKEHGFESVCQQWMLKNNSFIVLLLPHCARQELQHLCMP